MTIAKQIIAKCGGVPETARIVGASQSWVYRWTYPKERGGTGGRVPAEAQHKLLQAAAAGLVDIKPADFFAEAAE